MFFSVIAAYVIATAFAFCGVVKIAGCLMESEQGMGSFLFIENLVIAMWPLAVAMGLVMLVQIATQLERWRLLWTMAQAPASTGSKPAPAKATTAPAKPASPAAPAAPSPFSSHLAAVTPPILREESTPAKSPAPGMGEGKPGDIPLPPRPEAKPAPQSAEKKEGLSFFKID